MKTRVTPSSLVRLILASTLSLAEVTEVRAESLDDLLKDTTSDGLAETEEFSKSWDDLLEAMGNRKYAEAANLIANLRNTKGYVTPRRRDFIELAHRAVNFNSTLEEDKEDFRETFRMTSEQVVETERSIKRLQLRASAIAEKNRGRLPALTKENMDKQYFALQKNLKEKRALLEQMKIEAKSFEAARSEKIEDDVAAWISNPITEDDTVCSLILSTTYLDRVGDSEKIRKLSQGLELQQQEIIKANKIVEAIKENVNPLILEERGEEAQEKLNQGIASIRSSRQSEFVKTSAITKLEALRLKAAAAKRSEDTDKERSEAVLAELDQRLVEIEKKLEFAQESFGTVIRSIAGFTEFSGNLESVDDRKRVQASLREKIRSGTVEKEKVDNMIKARSEHVGILREIEVFLLSDLEFSVTQRARIENIKGTAETAVDLLAPAGE